MAVQTNVQQETSRRTDGNMDGNSHGNGEVERNVDLMRNGAPGAAVSNDLLHSLERSAQNLRHASENIENRGLKLLLKVLAQERVVMYNALRRVGGQAGDDPIAAHNKQAGTSLQEGLEDIQTSMTVQRQGREAVTAAHLVDDEAELLQAYDRAMQKPGSPELESMLASQRAHVAEFYQRLQSVGAGIDPIIARVFDTRIEGQSAVTRLRERGIEPAQIDIAEISRVAQPVARTASATASPKNAMLAGAISGALVGGIVGLALALWVGFTPQFVGWVTVGPWALLIGAALFGAVMGTVFGTFIGQNKREDDVAVTADSLINGEILVAVYPQPQQIALVEDVLQVHHSRELNR